MLLTKRVKRANCWNHAILQVGYSIHLLILYIRLCVLYRDSIVEKRKLLRGIGLDMEFPKISLIGIGFKLILSCVQCSCLTVGAKKETVDPRTTIPLITPSTAPPVPRRQYRRYVLLLSSFVYGLRWWCETPTPYFNERVKCYSILIFLRIIPESSANKFGRGKNKC